MRKFILPILMLTLFLAGCSANVNQVTSQLAQSNVEEQSVIINGEQCKECDDAATSTYRHPFNGKDIYYCTPHYEHHVDMMTKLFAD